jgi:small subunit ribosomal protein S6
MVLSAVWGTSQNIHKGAFDMPIYETVFMARQELSTAQVEKLTETMVNIATGLGAKLLKKEDWGLRTLAYPVKKAKKAHYVLIEMECPPAAIHEMERNMRFNEEVLRFLTVRLEAASTEQSPILNKDRFENDNRLDEVLGEVA